MRTSRRHLIAIIARRRRIIGPLVMFLVPVGAALLIVQGVQLAATLAVHLVASR